MFKKIFLLAVVFFFYANSFAQNNAIQINFIDELAKIGNDVNYPLNADYYLQRDLDFNDPNAYTDISLKTNFTSNTWGGIGNTNILIGPFTGSFDGNNHLIKNFSITNATYNYVGFFRYTIGATIKNIGLVNIKLNIGSNTVGGLIGRAENTNINNCFVTGTVFGILQNFYYSAYTTYFGGLIGYSVNANITNCYTNVDVGAIGFVGGLIGQSESSLPNKTYIKNCYTAGKQKLLLNNYGNSVLIGVRTNQSQAKDSIINTYSVSRFVGRTTPFTNTAGLFIGCSNDNYTNSYDTIFVKGCFSIENKITPINFYTSNGSFLLQNKTAKMIDTVFTGSSTKNFSPITGAAYNGTYLYSATNQQYPVLYRSDIPNTLLGGQLAVYPAVVEKNTGSINGFADSVTPVDNFTKNGNTTFNIHNINGITDINNPIFSYFNIRPTNGMLSWIEEIPAGEYLVEVRGINGTENSQSWIRVTISRGIDALVSVNAQSVQFTTKDSTRNGDYIVIDSLNLINRNFTVETWAKMDNRAAAWKRIFDFGTGANTNGVLLGFPTPTQFGFHCNGIDKVVTFPAGYNPLAWNHYALTQQNDSVKLYVNGVYVGGGRGAKPTIGFNKNYIGRSNFTTDSCTAGRFSECRVWLKAHTATQIAKLYNKKVPANADSLYVYLPLTTNVYGEYPILNSLLYNYAENVYGNFPTTYFNRVSNTTVKYKYDSSQQYVYGTLKTQLQDGETIQIAVKDSTVWYNVTEVSDYLFSYKLPIYFLSGNIYVRSIIGGAITNRFGNNLATSTYYVDWVGTNLRLNPNLTFNTIYRGSNAIFFQRNNTNTPFTILNPILANTTDAIQKTQAYSIDPYLYYYSTLLPAGRPKTNNSLYLDGLFTIYSYYPQGDTSIARYYGTNVLVPARNKDVSLVNTDGNTIIKIDNKAPSGVYNFAIQLNNSLNEPNFVEVRPDGTLRTIFVIQAILADSLKAVQYTTNKYVNTALKAVKSGSPVIIGNDGSVQAIRYQILARRNGVDITNQYSIDAANFSVSTTNRPIGTDSVFLTYTGWFNEVVKDTLIFGFVYTKPSIEFSPNESNDFSLINASASFTPLVLDSGGKTLTYILLDPNANFTFNNQTGKISLVNWEALTAGYTTTLRIEASNGTYKDTATFTYTKNAQNKVLYYSNSSYRTKSTNGEDYIQLPGIDLRNKAFGMDIWYKLNAQTGSWHRIMDIGTGGNNQGVLIAFPDTMQLFVRTPNQSDNTITIPAWVNIRNWNHYLISVSSAGVASFYINGRLIFNRTGGGTTPQTIFTSNYLGKSNYGGADAPSNGQFTDFRIWDNAIDSTVYNTRGINRITANTGANLIFYLPLSLPVFNRDLQLTDNYPLVNKAAIASTAILDSVSYIKGNSNSFNFDADRIFIAGQSSINNATKSVTLTSKNYASVADTNTKTPVSTLATANKYYWWGILPASQGTYLNNQIIGVNDYLNAGTSVNYNSIVTYLPRFPTYIPGDSIQVFTSKAGYVLPRNDYWVSTQKPIKYTLIDSGGLGNIIQVQLDTVTGRFSWLATEPNEAIYPIKISVTNEVGTININSKVLLSDSIQSIQYPVDSISVNYGNDSSSIPYTAGITPSTRFSLITIPNNENIRINPLNGKIYWTTNVSAGLYTLKVQASNYINTITKTIKLNIRLIAPTGLKYQPNNYTIVNTGFDTASTYINTSAINTGGMIKFTANTPLGCHIDSNTGEIHCKNTLVTAGNYTVVVNAQNTVGFVQDTVYINVITTSKDSILGYKNAYYTLNTDGDYKTGDYISLPTISLSNNFSIEAWVKLKDIYRDYQQIFDAGNGDNSHIVSIGTAGTTGRLFVTIPTAANGINSSNDIWDPQVAPRIANNTWFHIVYVKQATNVKLYLNGTKVIDNNTAAISYNDSLTRAYFGATNWTTNKTMLGQLNECRIWKRALTEYEINRYKTVFLTPKEDSLLLYLPLSGFLVKDTNIANGTVIKNSATGAIALKNPITLVGNGMKMSRDSIRQIVYGTHDSTTTLLKTITVKTRFLNQPATSDSTTTAVKYGNFWSTENRKIPSIFVMGTLQVSKSLNEIFNPNPFKVYFPPTAINYNNLNTFNVAKSTTPYITNKPIVTTNYDSTNAVYTISPVYTGISINASTGIITINGETVYNTHGKQVKAVVTVQTGLGSISTQVIFNIVPTNIIGYNNTSVCLPQTNGQDYIRIPSLDLRNSNFAIEIWFKLIGSPTNNKRIFDFAPGTTGNDRSGLILYFPVNKIKLGAFNQDGLIDLGNADTVLKNGVNEWNKYSIYYNATTKTYYVYINGIFKNMATVATDKYTAPLISNFLANNNFADPVTDGYFREFKVYKNIGYTDFIQNLSYNIVPNRLDNNLYYYLPLSNNSNNNSYIGNVTINNNTELANRALIYNPNAPNTNGVITTANNRAYYYGDSVNQIITGEFADQTNRLRFSYTNGIIKDTILPNIAIDKYSWQISGKNITGKFKVNSTVTPSNADSINILLIPSKLNYASNNRVFPIKAGNSGIPTYIGEDTVLFSIDSGNITGISINATTGVISWSNQIQAGLTKIRVLARNGVGSTNLTYIVNFQDTLQGFSYSPDSIQATGNYADSLPFLPSFTKGTGAVFSILNPTTGFSINANNGRIIWANTVTNGVYKIRVQANNLYNLPLTDTVTIKLTNQAPSNLKYEQDTMVISQGVQLQTLTPSINKGGLRTVFTINNIIPSGNFSIDSLTGVIKWASNTMGTYTITVVATNSLGFVSKTINITILSAANIALDYNNASLTLGILIPNTGDSYKNRVVLPSLDLRGAGYTIESWVKVLDAAGVGNWRRIFDFGTGQNYEGVVLGFQSATTFGIHASTSTDYIFNFPLNFNALNWNHYAVTVSDSVRLYVNGALIGTAISNKPSVIFNKNYLNYSNWVGDYSVINAYQESRVWKYARSGDEIVQNYQGSVPNDVIGLYYYLPFKQAGYLPGVIVNPTNFVLAPEEGASPIGNHYKTSIANAAVKSSISDSSKIVAVVPFNIVPNINKAEEKIPYYKIDSTRQKIQGNYAGTLAAGEVLQYSIDTGRTWKNIDFVQGNNWSQTIDNGFKYGLIKIRGAINNVATNRAFNDIEVLIYPYSPTNLRGTPINDGTVSLQFTPPIINANITGYKIYTSAGELVGTATQSPAIILGLNNEQTYQFQVSSINRKGESSLSALSNPVTVVNNILQISTYTNNVVGLNITPTTIVTPYVDYRVTYQLNTGYKLDSVIVDNVKYPDSTTGFTFKDVHNSHIIKVYVSKIPFTLTITKNSGGVVSPNQTTITTYYGDTLTVQFTPDNRYKVDSVFINGMYKADAVSSYTFKNIQENNTVRVVFKAKVYYNILVELVGNGNVNTIGIIEVESGTNYVVTYSPQIGNRLDSVIVNNILVQDSTNRYTFKNIQNNAKIRLVFSIKTYTITAVVKNGIVTPSGIKTYNYGTQIKYNYTPLNNSYVLDSLLIDGVLQFNPDTATYTFDSLKENHTIQIVYNLKANIKYTIYITKSVGVTVTPSLDQQVGYGGNLRVTWEANTGYVLDSIFVNKFYNRDSINGYTFTNVRSQQSIYIKYKLKTFTITSSAGLYGTINPLGISVVNYGTNKSFVLLPNVGYETDSLLLNGVSVTKPTDNIYSINNVTANQTIYVTFKIAVVNPCTGTKQTPNIVRVGDALKSDITSFSTQRWYLAGTIKDSTTNNTYTPTDAGVYTLLGVDAAGCESNISKKYYYAKTCITPAGRLGNGAYIQTEIVGNPKIMVIKWCTDLMQGDVRVQVLDISGEQIEDKKIPSSFGTYILNKLQIQSKKFIIKVMDNNGEIIQISDVVNNF